METESGAEIISSAHVRHILRYVNAAAYLRPDDVVLDAACGTGYGTRILAEKCLGVIGTDLNKAALEHAWQEMSINVQFMQSDLLRTSFNVDAIVSIETIEHFDCVEGGRLVSNFYDWLRPNGTLVISTPYCSKSGPSEFNKLHLCEYSLTDLEILLNNGGFRIDDMKLTRAEFPPVRLGYCMVKASKK